MFNFKKKKDEKVSASFGRNLSKVLFKSGKLIKYNSANSNLKSISYVQQSVCPNKKYLTKTPFRQSFKRLCDEYIQDHERSDGTLFHEVNGPKPIVLSPVQPFTWLDKRTNELHQFENYAQFCDHIKQNEFRYLNDNGTCQDREVNSLYIQAKTTMIDSYVKTIALSYQVKPKDLLLPEYKDDLEQIKQMANDYIQEFKKEYYPNNDLLVAALHLDESEVHFHFAFANFDNVNQNWKHHNDINLLMNKEKNKEVKGLFDESLKNKLSPKEWEMNWNNQMSWLNEKLIKIDTSLAGMRYKNEWVDKKGNKWVGKNKTVYRFKENYSLDDHVKVKEGKKYLEKIKKCIEQGESKDKEYLTWLRLNKTSLNDSKESKLKALNECQLLFKDRFGPVLDQLDLKHPKQAKKPKLTYNPNFDYDYQDSIGPELKKPEPTQGLDTPSLSQKRGQ